MRHVTTSHLPAEPSRKLDQAAERAPMPNQRSAGTKASIYLTDEEKAAVEASRHYVPYAKGRVSGYTAAVRAILRESLGLPPADDPHREQSARLKGKPKA